MTLQAVDFQRARRLSDRLIRPRVEKRSAYKVIEDLGLDAGLVLCLDAGDALSYDGTSQLWLDRTGGRYDFFRGATSGSEASDPTFNGSAGGLSSAEYWAFDGGDYFTLNQANPTSIENFHKDNAKFCFASWLQVPSAPFLRILAGNNAAGNSGIGVDWRLTNSHTLGFRCSNGSGTAFAKSFNSSLFLPDGGICFAAITVDEAADSLTMFLDGATQSTTAAYSSPSSSSATHVLQMGSGGNAANLLTNGARMMMFAAWEGAIPAAAQIEAFRQATRGRFGV